MAKTMKKEDTKMTDVSAMIDELAKKAMLL